MTVTLDKVFATLVPAMSIVSRVFPVGEREVASINSQDLHKVLGVGVAHSTWVKRQIDRFKMEKNKDYMVFALDPSNPSDWSKLADTKTSRSEVWFSLNQAQHIAALNTDEAGHLVREYLFAVTTAFQEAVWSAAKSAVEQANKKVQHFQTMSGRNQDLAKIALEKAGVKGSVTDFDNAQRAQQRALQATNERNAYQRAYQELWEHSSKAYALLSEGRNERAGDALRALHRRYGEYSDALRHELPATES